MNTKHFLENVFFINIMTVVSKFHSRKDVMEELFLTVFDFRIMEVVSFILWAPFSGENVERSHSYLLQSAFDSLLSLL